MGRCCRTPGKKMWPLRNSFIIGDYIMINYISFGGGVQSTAMVLMALAGEIEKPDLVVFADTGTEMPETYETVSRIGKLCNDQNLEFVVVKNYSEKVKGMSLIDWYSSKKMVPMVGIKWCTSKFKIEPIRRYVKTRVDKTKPKPWMCAWIGITSDESKRARHLSDVKFQIVKYPLLEISRQECINYIEKNYPNLKVSKSGCYCCPYANKKHWLNLKKNHNSLFQKSLQLEKNAHSDYGLYGGKSIEYFNYSHTLEDFGFENLPETNCDPAGACFT